MWRFEKRSAMNVPKDIPTFDENSINSTLFTTGHKDVKYNIFDKTRNTCSNEK